jgi:type III secretion protein J
MWLHVTGSENTKVGRSFWQHNGCQNEKGSGRMMKIRSLLTVMVIAFVVSACETEVYRSLTQKDANEMVAALARAGIPAKRELTDGTNYRITVAEDKLAPAIDALKRSGYPRESYRSMGEVFPGDGLVVTPYEQRVRMMFALSQEMGRTVTSINGVTSARVHIVVPDLDLRGLPLNKPSASVTAQFKPGLDVAELTSKIRMIVASGVQGLDYKNVSVALFPMQMGDEPAPVMSSKDEAMAFRANARPISVMLDQNAMPSSSGVSSGSWLASLLWALALLMGGGGFYMMWRKPGSSSL